ncbi:secreted frizzled-related protein 3-like [Hydractinia symbiolongicarpus]|uniref:secreted frizzled-related protein 3-like n=1 Tax=Hydractinia symbiolongicarpus TaxID=13093 RepID=UPI00254D712A|nr:secreted frizzled-related protein 3-like [Hydractinia symbiolongicarpus]
MKALLTLCFFMHAHCFFYNLGASKEQQCVPVKIKQCKGLGYNVTRPVDLYSSVVRNVENGKKYIELLEKTPCSKYAVFFLCSIYSPMCFAGHKEQIKPCRSVCYNVKRRCGPIMNYYGIEWPEELSCEKLPEHNSGVCIQPDVFYSAKQGRKRHVKNLSSSKAVVCKKCKKHPSHIKYRHYRKAAYVIEASIMSRETTANGRTKLYVNITRILKQGRVKIKLGKMKLWAPTKCICPKIDFDEKYFIFGAEHTDGKGRLLFDGKAHILPFKDGHAKVKKWQKKCKERNCGIKN